MGLVADAGKNCHALNVSLLRQTLNAFILSTIILACSLATCCARLVPDWYCGVNLCCRLLLGLMERLCH